MDVNKIEKVAKLASSNEQRSANGVRTLQQEHQSKCEQLDQLIQFKQEYESRLKQLGGAGVEVRQLRDYRLFLDKLHLAIEQQQQEVAASNTNVGVARDDWMDKSRRKNAIDNLVEQGQQQQLQAEEKIAQKESDERNLSARSF